MPRPKSPPAMVETTTLKQTKDCKKLGGRGKLGVISDIRTQCMKNENKE
jgi:hypothetical protein